MSKTKKIIIAVAATIVTITVVVTVLMVTGVLNVNLTKKAKVIGGVEKLGEAVSEPFEKVMEISEKNGTEAKIMNNMNDSAVDIKTELSANIEKLSIEDADSDTQDMIDTLSKLLGKAKVGLNIKYDGKESAYIKADGKIDNVAISGEAVYDGDQLAMRSEELNSKWLSVSGDDLEDLLDEAGVDIDQVKSALNSDSSSASKIIDALDIDEKTQKEIKERYVKVFKDYVKEKSKDIESKSAKVEVDGKEKSCSKLTLEFKEKDIQELLKKYVDTFKKDKQVKEILEKTLDAVADSVEESGEEDTAEEIRDAVNKIYDNIDEIKDEIDELEFDGSIKLVVYATNTKTYRTDIIIELEDGKVAIETTFNKKSTEMKISAKAQGMEMEIATITITEKDNGVSINAKLGKFLEQQLGSKCEFGMDYISEKSKTELKISANVGDYGKGTISLKTEVGKNEEKEYADTSTLDIDIDVPDYVTAKMSITAKTEIKLGSVSIPTVSSSDTVDVTDEKEVEAYMKDAEKNGNELIEDLKDIDGLEELIEQIQDASKDIEVFDGI